MHEGRSSREWVARLSRDHHAVFEDWEPFSISPSGIGVHTHWDPKPLQLPRLLRSAVTLLRKHVPDEELASGTGRPWNAPRYCLTDVLADDRDPGEQPACHLTFRGSDYRTFLATNGLEEAWLDRAGLRSEWTDRDGWVARWTHGDSRRIFENSFGINVLITAQGADGRRYAAFRRRSQRTAVRSHSTVATADEGLRRAYRKTVFDQKSLKDPAPDLDKAVRRAVSEEVGLSRELLREAAPILVSVGRVRSIFQPGALYHWPLTRTVRLSPVDELTYSSALAQDTRLEFAGDPVFVPFDRESLVEWIQRQEPVAPVESWVAVLAMLSLRTPVYARTFVSHGGPDSAFALRLCRDLKRHGVPTTMLPLDARPGDFIETTISNAIRESQRVLVITSEAALARAPVRREIRRAMRLEDTRHLKGDGSPVFVPVSRDNYFYSAQNDLVEVLREYWAADFRPGRRYAAALEKLLDALRIDSD